MQDCQNLPEFNDLLFVRGDVTIPASFSALRHKAPMIKNFVALTEIKPNSVLKIKIPSGIDCDSFSLFLELLQAHSETKWSEFVDTAVERIPHIQIIMICVFLEIHAHQFELSVRSRDIIELESFKRNLGFHSPTLENTLNKLYKHFLKSPRSLTQSQFTQLERYLEFKNNWSHFFSKISGFKNQTLDHLFDCLDVSPLSLFHFYEEQVSLNFSEPLCSVVISEQDLKTNRTTQLTQSAFPFLYCDLFCEKQSFKVLLSYRTHRELTHKIYCYWYNVQYSRGNAAKVQTTFESASLLALGHQNQALIGPQILITDQERGSLPWTVKLDVKRDRNLETLIKYVSKRFMSLDRKELLLKLPYKVLAAMLTLELFDCEYDYLFQFVLDFIHLKTSPSQSRELLGLIPFDHVSIRVLCSAMSNPKHSFILKDPSFLIFLKGQMFEQRSQNYFLNATQMKGDFDCEYVEANQLIYSTYAILLEERAKGNQHTQSFAKTVQKLKNMIVTYMKLRAADAKSKIEHCQVVRSVIKTISKRSLTSTQSSQD